MTNLADQEADNAGPGETETGPRIGLALSGGAALGWAHIGALRALTELGIRPHCIAGVSMGAIVAVAYADGHLDDLERFARDVRYLALARLSRIRLRRGGWLSNDRIAAEILAVLDHDRIEDLPIPFGAGCADLATGESVALTEGPIATAIQASTAVPGLFKPVYDDGRVLVDGGVVDLVPVRLCRQMGASHVIAVDVLQDYRNRAVENGFKPGETGGGQGGQTVLWTSLALMLRQLAWQGRALNPPDVTICPPVGPISPLAFKQAEALIALGYESVQDNAGQLRALMALETGAETEAPISPGTG